MQCTYKVFSAHTHVGTAYDSFLSEFGDWQEAGFRVNSAGKPIADYRGNTIAKYTEEDFDPSDPAHVALAVDYATGNGDTSEATIQWLMHTFGIPQATIRNRLTAE
jgi:hypothetical protein